MTKTNNDILIDYTAISKATFKTLLNKAISKAKEASIETSELEEKMIMIAKELSEHRTKEIFSMTQVSILIDNYERLHGLLEV